LLVFTFESQRLTEEAMLVLSRRVGEKIQIGDDVTITIVRMAAGVVRVGIDAPRETAVVRAELLSNSGYAETPTRAEPACPQG
jgi:carbon storage regulator